MKTTQKIIALTALVVFITLSLLSIKGCGSIWDGNGDLPQVAIRLGSVGNSPATEEDVRVPLGVYTVLFSITGPGMDPITRTVIASGYVSETFDVPVGDERTFTVTALDMDGTVQWEGETTTSVLGDPITITIDMQFAHALDIQPPTEPTGLVIASSSEGSFSLGWAPSSDDNSVAGYYIYELVNVQMFLVDSVPVAGFSETGLAGGKYCFIVTAIDPAGNESGFSTQIASPPCITLTGPVDVTPPGMPQNFTATFISNTAMELSWEPPADTSDLIGYNIYNSGESEPYHSVSAPSTSLSIVKLAGGTYCYTTTSVDKASLESAPSPEKCVDLAGVIVPSADTEPPSVPTGLAGNTTPPTEIALWWEPSTDDTAVAGYSLYELDVYIASSVANSISIERLTPGEYCFKVSATDEAGNESAMSQPACVLVGGSAYNPRVPNCPEFLTYLENPGGNYNWHPNSNPPKCYGEVPPPPKTWWKKGAQN